MQATINDLMVIHHAFADFKISDQADHGGDSTKKYYGYVNREGEWYIMRRDLTANTYRYYKGGSNYAAGWAGREGYTYERYDEVFG